MKKITTILALICLLASCTTQRSAYTNHASILDFIDYAKKGFFITESNSVSFEYTPIGSIAVLVDSGWEVIEKSTKNNNSVDDVYGASVNVKQKYGGYITARPQDGLNNLHETAVEMGANGIINLKVVYSSRKEVISGMEVTVPMYNISGMAIKIK